MSRRGPLVVVAAAVLLLGAGAVYLLRPGAHGPADLGEARDAAAALRRADAPQSRVNPLSDDAAAARRIAAAAFADDADGLPAPRDFEPWPKEGLAVEVAARADGEPVGNAEVLWLEFAELDLDRLSRLDAMRRDPEDNARRLARRFKTDDKGRCVVPYCRELTLLMARKDGLFGGQRLSPTTKGPLRIDVGDDEFVRVRVRDPEGNPVPHVPLDVCSYNGPRADSFLRFAADDAGEASLKNLGLFFELFRFEPRALLAAGFPTHGRPETAFVPTPPPAEPVELVVAPQGALVVRVVDADGAAVALAGYATLRAKGFADGASRELYAPGDFRQPLVAGESRWPFVGLGLTVEAQVQFFDGTEARATGPGPAAAGEEAELLVTKVVRPPAVFGRAVDALGEPLAERRCEARVLYEGIAPEGRARAFRTESDGSFRVELGEKDDPRPPSRVEFSLLDGSDRVGSAVRDLAPAGVAPPEFVPLGDVVLAPAPPVVAGVVVDEAGAPVRYARVDVAQRVAEGDKRRPTAEGRAFLREEGLGTTTDEQGKFVVRSHRPVPFLRLTASRTGYAGEATADVASGATDVRMVLRVGGVIEARLLLDADVPRELLRARLRVRAADAGPDAPYLYDREATPEANGFVQWNGAPGGVGHVFVRAPSYGRKNLAFVDALRVEAGGTTSDPRLAPIDLRGRLRVVAVEVVDAEGRGVGDAEYETLPVDGSPGTRNGAGRGGRTRILAPLDDFDLRLTSPRRRSILVTRPGPFVRAVLRDPHAAYLRVPFDLPAVEEGVEYVVQLDPVGRSPDVRPDPAQRMSEMRREDRVAVPGRELALRVAAPGRYAVVWTLEKKRGGGYAQARLNLGDRAQFVDFAEQDDDLRLDLSPPPQRAVDRAKPRLR